MKVRLWRGTRPQWLHLLWAALLLFLGAMQLSGWGTGGATLAYAHAHPPVYVFPAGGRTLFPRYRLVALYGTPDAPVLGALGEQPLQPSLERARALADQYQPLLAEPVYPALEIIATVASSSPSVDSSYSYPIDSKKLAEWVEAAKAASVYVVLDLQPGREDFLTQAKRLQPLLLYPNVGLALDPEWRLAPTQLPLTQIGSVNIDEVNKTAAWLAGLTAVHRLPQKLFLLHQFRLDMLPNRNRLDTSHSELAYVVQMDGQGTQPQKLSTWDAITAEPPANMHFGWKNFYQKDSPIRSPDETMQLTPHPWYVSYQ